MARMISFSVFIHKWTGLFTAVFSHRRRRDREPSCLREGARGSRQPRAVCGAAAQSMRRGNPLRCWIRSSYMHRPSRRCRAIRSSAFHFLRDADRSVRFNLTRSDPDLADADQAFFDPYDGRLLGIRKYGATPFDRTTLIGFIYRLHYALALPKPYGEWLFGIVALVWTVNCWSASCRHFRGFRHSGGAGCRPRLIKRNASTYRLHYDIHRASGLWHGACCSCLRGRA